MDSTSESVPRSSLGILASLGFGDAERSATIPFTGEGATVGQQVRETQTSEEGRAVIKANVRKAWVKAAIQSALRVL